MSIEKLSRREFLLSLLSASALLLLDGPLHSGASAPAIAAVNRQELGRFSGDILFEMMHVELLGKKREAKRRAYPAAGSPEKIDVLVVGGGIAGLDTAWYLLTSDAVKKSGATVRLLELNDEVGGTAKEYAWEGIPYSNSAAYFYTNEPEHPDMKLYRALGVLDEMAIPGAQEKESVLVNDVMCPDFFVHGRGKPDETKAIRALTRYFGAIAREGSPPVPYAPAEGYTRAEFKRVDEMSFGAYLEKRSPITFRGKTHSFPCAAPAIFLEYVENYCYSSFGCSSRAVSAWQGINWFASEFEENAVGVLPGGNGRIATRLREKIDGLDARCIRTSTPVVDIRHDARRKTSIVTVAPLEGGYRTIEARYVILTCPLVVSKRLLLHEFPPAVLRAIEKFRYSAYIVANAFTRKPLPAGYWDTYCLNGFPEPGAGSEALYRGKAFMDIISADWCMRRKGLAAPRDKGVITVYAPQPFDGQREALLRDDYCEEMKEKIRKELVFRLAPLGMDNAKIVDIRIARWGHAMFQANPGVLSSGVLDAVQASVAHKGILFAGTELMGAPTIENCHLTARDAASALARRIVGKHAIEVEK